MSWTKVAAAVNADYFKDVFPDREAGWVERHPGLTSLLMGALTVPTGVILGDAASGGKGPTGPAIGALFGVGTGALLGYGGSKLRKNNRESYNALSPRQRLRRELEEANVLTLA